VLQSLLPSVGWQSVFFDAEAGEHLLGPVHALALGQRRTYDAHTWRLVRAPCPGPPDEFWEVFGVAYEPSEGRFAVCDESSNFCGLLPPGMTLSAFAAVSGCHPPQTQP
jgi:hypothetical protein